MNMDNNCLIDESRVDGVRQFNILYYKERNRGILAQFCQTK